MSVEPSRLIGSNPGCEFGVAKCQSSLLDFIGSNQGCEFGVTKCQSRLKLLDFIGYEFGVLHSWSKLLDLIR